MKKYKLKVEDRNYDIDIISVEDNIAEVQVNGVVYKVEVDRKIQQTKTPVLVRSKVEPSTDIHKATAKTSAPAPSGSMFIKSSLPGIILKIDVKVGDKVKVGDHLLILEAMKMENNIRSDKEGTITNIRVKERDAVLEGDVLIEIGA